MSIQAGIDMLSGGDDENSGATENVTPETTETPTETPESQSENSGGHPAWSELLNRVPESEREFFQQEFRKWDSGVQRRFEEVQSRYKPYESFVSRKPEELESALTLLQVFNSDPRRLYDQMETHFGFNRGQGRSDNLDVGEFADDDEDEKPEIDLTNHPAIQQMMQQQEQLRQYILAEQQREEAARHEAWVDSEIDRMAKAHPGIELDRDYILSKALAIAEKTGNADKAIEHATIDFVSMVQKYRTAPVAPRVLPTSGGMPSLQSFDPEKLDGKQRREVGLEMLRKLNAEE